MISASELTVCLVICNEEAVIERCLHSLVSISKNIFVVHDGPCLDKSLEICKKYKCRVVVRDHLGEPETHRVWQYSQLDSKWVLQIDADEYLSSTLANYIENLISSEVSGYTCEWPIWNKNTYVTQHWPRKLFLFKLQDSCLLASLHEAVRVTGKIKHLPLRLEHKPNYYNLSWNAFRKKWLRWATKHARTYLLQAEDIPRFNDPNSQLCVHYANWMKYAPLSAIPLGVYHFLGSLKSGAIKEGWTGVKASFLMSLYYVILNVLVAKEKYAKII